MSDTSETTFFCKACKQDVNENDTYCRNCGEVFSDTLCCINHSNTPADGVCVICVKPFCNQCGGKDNNIYLCDEHDGYEVCEGMARIAGTTDNVLAQFVTNCLEQAGFHPFLYSRNFNPGADVVAINKIYRNFGNHPIIELKILVPFDEVLKAEKVLDELELEEE